MISRRPGSAPPVDPQRHLAYQQQFGIESLHRLVIADGQIGRGFVTGARLAPTALIRLTRDPEVLQRYGVGRLQDLRRMA